MAMMRMQADAHRRELALQRQIAADRQVALEDAQTAARHANTRLRVQSEWFQQPAPQQQQQQSLSQLLRALGAAGNDCEIEEMPYDMN